MNRFAHGQWILAKFTGDGAIRFVKRILRQGREIDSESFSDLQSFDNRVFARRWPSAEKALETADKMRDGGDHDYRPMRIDAQLSATGLAKYQTGIAP
jgi:hypothetical protein